MTPETTQTDPTLRQRKARAGQPPGRLEPASAGSELEALSAATGQFPKAPPAGRRRRRTSDLSAAVMAALGVGALLALAGRLEYLCGATFEGVGAGAAAGMSACRRDLFDHACRAFGTITPGGEAATRWSVDSPGPTRLRLCLRTSSRRAGLERVRATAEAFLAQTRAQAETARSTPGHGERVLGEYASDLKTRLDQTDAQVESLAASLPGDDPNQERSALLQRWNTLRAGLIATGEELARATENQSRLQSLPAPTHGIVPANSRKKALAADAALQQDLRELAVNLTNLKFETLIVWQESAAPLEQLTLAVDELTRSQPERYKAGLSAATRADVEKLLAFAEGYREALSAHSASWSKEFTALKQLEVDAMAGDVIEAHRRVRSLLNDFLFAATQRLADMSSAVQALGVEADERARHHVLHSRLIRGYGAVQSAHHRFEHAALAIDARGNFQLEIAMKSARGLRRRSQERIRAIDDRLQRRARADATRQRKADLEEATQQMHQARARVDALVVNLVDLQQRLNASSDSARDYLRALLQAEAAENLSRVASGDLTRTERRLDELRSLRLAMADSMELKLLDCSVIAGPINLPERLRAGGLGALATFIVILLGQRWYARRAVA